jgi:hypothetical protein
MALVLARRATSVFTESTVYFREKWGGATEELPAARPRLNPPHEAARRRNKESILRDTRTGLVVLAAEPEPETSSRTHKRLQSDDITKIIISV